MSLSLLGEGKTIRIKAHGYSMYPVIKPGSVIIIEPLRIKGTPVVGEIVAIEREKGIVVHRVVKIKDEGGKRFYITRGDSNSRTDQPVPVEKIIGRVTGMEGFAHLPRNFFARPNYFFNRIRVVTIQLLNRLRNLKNKILNL